mmetsp:Transcript_106172/g.300395  ORF Transcript_106172/g.300395 Transcript_106172/m.300395 type:complete len:517 (+) Transcript_106172:96-1646(+)
MPGRAEHEEENGDGSDSDTGGELEQPLARQAVAQPPRQYGLDWMRITAIYLVVFFHIVQGLDWVKLWEGEAKQHAKDYMRTSYQVGMPAFFYISGRAQGLARHKTLLEQLKARVLKLLVPFCACYVVLIPPWYWAHHRLRDDVPDSLLRFIAWYWSPDNFFFDPAWLWFLPVLFAVTTWSIPLFFVAECWSRRIYIPVLVVQAALIWLTFSVWLGYSHVFSFFCILGTLAPAACVMLVPFPDQTQLLQPYEQMALSWLAIRALAALLVASSCGIVSNFSYSSDKHTMSVCVVLFMLFYVQGYFSERWGRAGATEIQAHLERDDPHAEDPYASEEPDSDDSDMAQAKPTRVQALLRAAVPGRPTFKKVVGMFDFVMAICGFALVVGSGTLGRHEEFYFPLYSGTYHDSCLSAVIHVLGSWTMVAVLYYYFWAYAKSQVDPALHRFLSESTMIVYLFHWMFIKFFAFLVVQEYGLVQANGWAWPFLVVPLTFAIAVGGCLLIFMMLKRVPALGLLFGL